MSNNNEKTPSYIESAKKFLSENKENILSGVSSAIDYISKNDEKTPNNNQKTNDRLYTPNKTAIFLFLILSISVITLYVHIIHKMGGTIFAPIHLSKDAPGDLAAHTAGLIGFSIITDILGKL